MISAFRSTTSASSTARALIIKIAVGSIDGATLKPSLRRVCAYSAASLRPYVLPYSEVPIELPAVHRPDALTTTLLSRLAGSLVANVQDTDAGGRPQLPPLFDVAVFFESCLQSRGDRLFAARLALTVTSVFHSRSMFLSPQVYAIVSCLCEHDRVASDMLAKQCSEAALRHGAPPPILLMAALDAASSCGNMDALYSIMAVCVDAVEHLASRFASQTKVILFGNRYNCLSKDKSLTSTTSRFENQDSYNTDNKNSHFVCAETDNDEATCIRNTLKAILDQIVVHNADAKFKDSSKNINTGKIHAHGSRCSASQSAKVAEERILSMQHLQQSVQHDTLLLDTLCALLGACARASRLDLLDSVFSKISCFRYVDFAVHDLQRVFYMKKQYNELFIVHEKHISGRLLAPSLDFYLGLAAAGARNGDAKMALGSVVESLLCVPAAAMKEKTFLLNSALNALLRGGDHYGAGELLASRLFAEQGVQLTSRSYGKLIYSTRFIKLDGYVEPANLPAVACPENFLNGLPIPLRRSFYWASASLEQFGTLSEVHLAILLSRCADLSEFDLGAQLYANPYLVLGLKTTPGVYVFTNFNNKLVNDISLLLSKSKIDVERNFKLFNSFLHQESLLTRMTTTSFLYTSVVLRLLEMGIQIHSPRPRENKTLDSDTRAQTKRACQLARVLYGQVGKNVPFDQQKILEKIKTSISKLESIT